MDPADPDRGSEPVEPTVSPRRSCSEAAARFLSDRPHFRRQLLEKLQQRGYSRLEIEDTLDRFVALRLLDEMEAVRSFVEQRRRRQAWGRTRLRAELGRRGADPQAIEEVLAELTDEDDEEVARREAEIELRRPRPNPDRLARRLARKGIPSRVIVRLLDEVRAEIQSR